MKYKPYEFREQDAFDFARKINAETHPVGDELIFKICPYCNDAGTGNTNKFAINLRTGQFKCLRASCGVQGNMIRLSRDFDFSLGNEVDEYYAPKKTFRKLMTPKEPIIPKPPAIAYLESRGISEAIAKKYEITTQRDRDNILVLPFYDENGKLQFVKYRKMDFDKEHDSAKEWCEKDCKPILFGMKQCNENFDRLIITEGQLDSLSVAEAGIPNAVSVPTGANGFTWVPYCYNWVAKFKEIVVFGDYEKEHITLLDDIKRRFPCKMRHVREQDYLDCKDANELLVKHGADAVRAAVENAVMLPVKRVIKLSDVKAVNIFELPKLKTGIRALDQCLYGGLPFGMVCVLAGKRGDGKSTFGSQIMARAVEQDYPTFTYSGELPNYLYKAWLDFQIAGRDHIIENVGNFGTVNRFIQNKNQALIDAWYEEKAFIYDNSIIENDEKEDLLKSIEESIMQYGTKVILIDNLMTAMYIDEVKGSDKYDQQGRFVRELTKIALRYDVLIILVAHRRKNSFSQDANDEISGSGDITNLAGLTLSYDRPSQKMINDGDADESQRLVIVAKNRLFGKINLEGILTSYDEKSKRIYVTPEELSYQYSWDTEQFVPAGQMEIPF